MLWIPMPAPYHIDLRAKAVAAVDRGGKKSHVSKLFPISRNTLDLWLMAREQTSTVAPKAPLKKHPSLQLRASKSFDNLL